MTQPVPFKTSSILCRFCKTPILWNGFTWLHTSGNQCVDRLRVAEPEESFIAQRPVPRCPSCDGLGLTLDYDHENGFNVMCHADKTHYWDALGLADFAQFFPSAPALLSAVKSKPLCDGCAVNSPWEHRCWRDGCECEECGWPLLREKLYLAGRAGRKSLTGLDDFDALRTEIQCNYVLDAAREHFESLRSLSPEQARAKECDCEECSLRRAIDQVYAKYENRLDLFMADTQKQLSERNKPLCQYQKKNQ